MFGFNLFGNNPKAAKVEIDNTPSQEDKERMQRRRHILMDKQRQATEIIQQNASRGRVENTNHIFSLQDKEELDSLNRQMGGKRRRRTQRRKGKKARKTHRRRVSKTHRRKGKKGKKGRKARKTHRRRR